MLEYNPFSLPIGNVRINGKLRSTFVGALFNARREFAIVYEGVMCSKKPGKLITYKMRDRLIREWTKKPREKPKQYCEAIQMTEIQKRAVRWKIRKDRKPRKFSALYYFR